MLETLDFEYCTPCLFAVPGVMGGTTVYFNAADFDDVFEAANAEKEGTEGEGGV